MGCSFSRWLRRRRARNGWELSLQLLASDATDGEEASDRLAALLESGKLAGGDLRSLVVVLGANWRDLTPNQRQRLLPAIAEVARTCDDTTLFLASVETMARESNDPRAIARIVELYSTPNETKRFMVAHALWHVLADGEPAAAARAAAIDALRRMAEGDESDAVRSEARRIVAAFPER